ncbi:MAG: hypothetical protein M0Z58_03380 [Nitrospiraceae bacterium]|nr:hypothetical protein [Nitrospiraceae bacterium]
MDRHGACESISFLLAPRAVSGLLVILFLLPVKAFGFAGKSGACAGDCRACHTLKTSEAQDILSSFNPAVKVLGVENGVEGLWEVTFEYGGKKDIAYIDYDKKHLIHGFVVDIKTKQNLTNQRISDLNRVDVSRIPLKDALVLGDADAPIKVIVFDDPV